MEAEALHLTDHAEGVVLPVRVIPRAGRDAIAGVRQGALLVRLAAAPVDGAANAALVRVLAVALDVPRRNVSIVSGDRGRDKRVRVAGVSAAALTDRLSAILSR